MGGPEMAPKPPTFGAPRHKQPGRSSIEHGGPEMAPKPPAFGAPRHSRVAPLNPLDNPLLVPSARERPVG